MARKLKFENPNVRNFRKISITAVRCSRIYVKAVLPGVCRTVLVVNSVLEIVVAISMQYRDLGDFPEIEVVIGLRDSFDLLLL